MLRTFLAPLFLTAAITAQSSSDTAAGLFPFLVGNLDGQEQQLANSVAAHDLDTLYVSVFRATGPQQGDLWITDTTGTWNPAWGPVRPTGAGLDLEKLIAAAHAAGLRVVGVLKCFDSTVQPTSAAHRDYLLKVTGWLLDRYRTNGEPVFDLDGLALDYVRYVSSGTGNDPRPVTAFCADVKRLLGARSLHAYLVANRWSFDGPVYDTQFNSYTSVLQQLSSQFGQHWEQLARHVDVMMPMAYTADGSIYNTAAQHTAYVKQTAVYARQACTNAGVSRRVNPVIKTYSSSTEVTTAQTVEASILGALQGGDGYQSFRYHTTKSAWWAKLQQYATPGPNWPVPDLLVSATGLGGTFDATGSTDPDQPSNVLLVRFDLDNDGTPETPWLLNGAPRQDFLRHPGDWRVAVSVKDVDGHVSVTTRELRVAPVVTVNANTYHASIAGPYPITVDVGPRGAGVHTIFIGNLSGAGTTPWQSGYDIPFVWDAVSDGLMQSLNTPIFKNSDTILDAQGRATAVFEVPPGIIGSLAWQEAHWSAAGLDAQGNAVFIGNAARMLILP